MLPPTRALSLRGLCAAAASALGNGLARDADGPPLPRANVSVAASLPLEVIRPELFGLDLEFTRHDVWSGLSAELISNRLFAVQPPGTSWPQPWPSGFPPRWAALPGGAAPSVAGLSSSVACALSAAQPLCGLVQVPVGDGFDAGMSFGSAIGLEAGRAYTFSAVLRATGTASGAGLVLSVAIAPALFATNLSVPDTTASGAWTTLSASFVASATTPRADSLILSVAAAQGTLEFNATSLLPDDSFLGMRADVVDALGDLAFKGPLRYPGGCYAPFYRWKDGLLPLLARPTSFTPPTYCTAVAGGVNAYSDGFMQNGPGIDEYVALARRIGAQPAVSIALQFGTPAEVADARDWVEYCNGDATTTVWGALRAARGRPEPYAIKVWYLGNEIAWQARYPDYPNRTDSIGAMSGADYRSALEALVPAMRAVDPSLQLLVVEAGAGFDTPAWQDADFSPFVAAASAHVGYANSDSGGSPASAAAATAQAKIPSSTVLSDASAVRAVLDSGSGSTAHVRISIDEWGLGPPWQVRQFGVAHAMFGASFLTMASTNAVALGLAFTNYFEPVNEGAIEVLQFSAQPTPLGVVMPVFASLAGATRLAVSQDPGGDDDVVAVAAVAASAARPGGKAIAVVLTNRNATAAFTQWLRFDGVAVAPTATVATLAASGGFGPGSFFSPSTGAVAVSASGWAAILLPPFSVASVQVECLSC